MMTDQPRLEVRTRPLGADARVEVYRRDDRLARGACMSLHAGQVEVLRWDLQPGAAHRHHAIGSAPRLYMPREWPLETLVELACSELVEHSRPLMRIVCPKAARPSREALAEAAGWAAPLLAEIGATS